MSETETQPVAAFDVSVLGDLELRAYGVSLPIGGPLPRRLLLRLLLQPNAVVPVGQLVDDLWPDDPPTNAEKTVQIIVSRLRRTLGDQRTRLESRSGGGYRFVVSDDEVDLARAEALARDAERLRQRSEYIAAAEVASRGLSLWRGAPLMEVRGVESFLGDVARVEELRIQLLHTLIDADIGGGQAVRAIGRLEVLVREHPLRERLWVQLMLALHADGRQGEALTTYLRARDVLLDELGIEPGPELREAQRLILAEEPPSAGPPPEPGHHGEAHVAAPSRPEVRLPHPTDAAAAPQTHASRRVVSVMFADLVSSTSLGEKLDAEAFRGVQDRFYAAATTAVSEHGGVVERFIGDAVMAVFGSPLAHEDDPVRAVRTANSVRSSVQAMSLDLNSVGNVGFDVRIGITTGEALATPSTSGELLVTGDVVNTAARLQAVAGSGDILLDAMTQECIRHLSETESIGDLELKGKTERVRAFKLASFGAPASNAATHSHELVGRERELSRLRDELQTVLATRQCRLVTLIAGAGFGKTRLMHEFLASAPEAGHALGRCAAYGQTSTYAPMGEAIASLAARTTNGPAPPLKKALAEVVRGLDDHGALLERVSDLLGLSLGTTALEEMTWALRHLLRGLAERRPLVVVIEDIHWAQPGLLDLIEQMTYMTHDAPLLLVTTARPELVESRPTWREVSTIVELEPLTEDEADRHLGSMLGMRPVPTDVRRHVLEVSGGNPLFLEQFAAMLAERNPEDASARIEVPPTIHAVIAARLDQLPPKEQSLLEAASIIGRSFSSSAVSELSAAEDRTQIWPTISSLVRRRLIRSDRSTVDRDSSFRFDHVLLRDVAYRRLPKRSRGLMHEQLANWLEQKSGIMNANSDETMALHLYEAHSCYRAVGDTADASRTGSRAGELLRAAGERALARWDWHSAIDLLTRAIEIPDENESRRWLPAADVVWALGQAAQTDEAVRLLDKAREALRSSAPQSKALRYAELAGCELTIISSGANPTECRRLIEISLDEFEAERDDEGLARAWSLQMLANWLALEVAAAQHAGRKAVEHSERVAKSYLGRRHPFVGAELYGITPAVAAISQLRADLADAGPLDRQIIQYTLTGLEGLVGNIDGARDAHAAAHRVGEEFGFRRMSASLAESMALAEFYAGEPERAEAVLRISIDRLRTMGLDPWLGLQLGQLAEALARQGKVEEALRVADEAAAISDDHDRQNWCQIHQARALAFLGQGSSAAARDTAALAWNLMKDTELIAIAGDASLLYARALAACGDYRAAADQALEARRLYAAKECSVGERAAEEFFASLPDRTDASTPT